MTSEQAGKQNNLNIGIPDAVIAFVSRSPASMWVADPSGSLVFENDANRKRFGVENDEEIVGKYNIFRDEEIANIGVIPQIRQGFEQGGLTEFVIDYDFTEMKNLTSAHPAHQVLRVFLYAIENESGKVEYVVVQNEDYTNVLRVQTALTESETRYRELVEYMSDWIWTIDLEGRIMYSNPVVERILGYRFDEVSGKSILSFVIPDDQEQTTDVFLRCVEKSVPLRGFTIRVQHKDGTLRYLETNAEPIIDAQSKVIGYRGITRDITQRRQIEIALTQSEENFRTIFDHVPAAVIVYDREGKVTNANTACQRVFGFALEDMIGRSMFDTIVRPDDRTKREAVITRVFAGETTENIEWQDRRADGSLIYVLTNVAPIYDSSGRISMGLSLAIDITEYKLTAQRQLEIEAHKREFYRRTIQAATNGKLVICDKSEIERIAGKPIEAWAFHTGDYLIKIRSKAAEIAQTKGMAAERVCDFVICIGESTANALRHADGGTASLHKVTGGLMFIVADHGSGIDALAFPDVALKRGHTTAVSLGMGYKVMIEAADRVYLATGSTGTTVAIEMRFCAPEKLSEIVTLPDTW